MHSSVNVDMRDMSSLIIFDSSFVRDKLWMNNPWHKWPTRDMPSCLSFCHHHETRKDDNKLRTSTVFFTIFLVWTLIIKQMTHVLIIILILVINGEAMLVAVAVFLCHFPRVKKSPVFLVSILHDFIFYSLVPGFPRLFVTWHYSSIRLFQARVTALSQQTRTLRTPLSPCTGSPAPQRSRGRRRITRTRTMTRCTRSGGCWGHPTSSRCNS